MKKTMVIFGIGVLSLLFTSCDALLYGLLMGAAMSATPTYTPSFSTPYISSTPPPIPVVTPPPIDFTTPVVTPPPIDFSTPVPDYSSTPTYTTPATNSPSSSNESTSSNRPCYCCNGTGRVEKLLAGTDDGNRKYCSECGQTVSTHHYHGRCDCCNGKGYN